VGDVVAHELPTEGVRRVFDRISLHPHSVEHLFESGKGRDPNASPPTARLPGALECAPAGPALTPAQVTAMLPARCLLPPRSCSAVHAGQPGRSFR
jgi:hypothetical protein